ncbi:MAG: hypothetical protein HRT74_05630 [Flavobacteriales bacterium]|nr:hypothetical protein [Flavobacteriales bacterium]
MVCNPPFFADGTQSKNHQRAQARSEDSMPLGRLWSEVIAIANPKTVQLLLPANREKECLLLATKEGFDISRQTYIAAKPSKERHCVMLSFIKSQDRPESVQANTLFVRDDSSEYSSEYLNLVKGFYLRR